MSWFCHQDRKAYIQYFANFKSMKRDKNKRGMRELDDGHVLKTDGCLEKNIIQGSIGYCRSM